MPRSPSRRAPSRRTSSSSARKAAWRTSPARCSRKPSSSSRSRKATGRNCAGSASPSRARTIARRSACSASRKRSTRPSTRTRSPRSKRPPRTSASRKTRAASAPVRSRSSSARYGAPLRVSSRSLRVHAKTPAISSPARRVAIVGAPAVAMGPLCTVNSMQPLIWDSRPDGLRAPALVCAFTGWNDAGDAASAAVQFLGSSLGAARFARMDAEEFFDFQATRPKIRLVDGRTREIEWPEVEVWAARAPRAPRDLVLVSGPEPSMRWRTFSRAVVELAEALGTQLVVTLGALLADVPHSRPVPITGLATDEALTGRLGISRTSYEGPTGIVGVLHAACQDAGVPSASLWASVPHYVAAAPNPKAALALVRKLERLVGVTVDASELEGAAADYERQVSLAVQSDPDVQAFVERLEKAAAEEEPPFAPGDLPSGDVLAREFQRFLRQRGPEDEA